MKHRKTVIILLLEVITVLIVWYFVSQSPTSTGCAWPWQMKSGATYNCASGSVTLDNYFFVALVALIIVNVGVLLVKKSKRGRKK